MPVFPRKRDEKRRRKAHSVPLPAGEHVPAHSHPHEQYSIVLEGECDVKCGGEEFHLTKGGICYAPSNVEHELWMWEESDVVIMDIFNPVRQDWIDPLDE